MLVASSWLYIHHVRIGIRNGFDRLIPPSLSPASLHDLRMLPTGAVPDDTEHTALEITLTIF